MDNRQVGVVSAELVQARTQEELKQLYLSAIELVGESPFVDFHVAGWSLHHSKYEQAKRFLLKVLLEGRKPRKCGPDDAHAFGSSATFLFTLFRGEVASAQWEKLSLLSFYWLSKAIAGHPAPFESHKNRADLLTYSMNLGRVPDWPMFMCPEPLASSDYARAAEFASLTGFQEEARTYIRMARYWQQEMEGISVAGRDADKYTLAEYCEVGTRRLANLEALSNTNFQGDKYRLTKSDLKALVSGLAPRPH
jgi:hypothetical protein